jgi:hypothetical protein
VSRHGLQDMVVKCAPLRLYTLKQVRPAGIWHLASAAGTHSASRRAAAAAATAAAATFSKADAAAGEGGPRARGGVSVGLAASAFADAAAPKRACVRVRVCDNHDTVLRCRHGPKPR